MLVIATIITGFIIAIGYALAYSLLKIRSSGLKSNGFAGLACAMFALLAVLRDNTAKDNKNIALNLRSKKKGPLDNDSSSKRL